MAQWRTKKRKGKEAIVDNGAGKRKKRGERKRWL